MEKADGRVQYPNSEPSVSARPHTLCTQGSLVGPEDEMRGADLD